MTTASEADADDEELDNEFFDLSEHVQSGLGIHFGAADDASDAVTVSANPTPRPGADIAPEEARPGTATEANVAVATSQEAVDNTELNVDEEATEMDGEHVHLVTQHILAAVHADADADEDVEVHVHHEDLHEAEDSELPSKDVGQEPVSKADEEEYEMEFEQPEADYDMEFEQEDDEEEEEDPAEEGTEEDEIAGEQSSADEETSEPSKVASPDASEPGKESQDDEGNNATAVADSHSQMLQDEAQATDGRTVLQQDGQEAPAGEQVRQENGEEVADEHESQTQQAGEEFEMEFESASLPASEDASQEDAKGTAVEAAQLVDADIPTSTRLPLADAVVSETEGVAVVAENAGGEEAPAEESAEPAAAEEGVNELAGSEAAVAEPQQTVQEPASTVVNETLDSQGSAAEPQPIADFQPLPASVHEDSGSQVNVAEVQQTVEALDKPEPEGQPAREEMEAEVKPASVLAVEESSEEEVRGTFMEAAEQADADVPQSISEVAAAELAEGVAILPKDGRGDSEEVPREDLAEQIPVGELEQIADSLPVPERNELGEVAVEAQPSVGLQESSATMVNETLVSEVMAVEPQEVPSADQLLHAACAAPSGAESALQEHEKEKAPVTDSTQTALQDDVTVLEPEGAGALQQGDQIAPDGEQSGKEMVVNETLDSQGSAAEPQPIADFQPLPASVHEDSGSQVNVAEVQQTVEALDKPEPEGQPAREEMEEEVKPASVLAVEESSEEEVRGTVMEAAEQADADVPQSISEIAAAELAEGVAILPKDGRGDSEEVPREDLAEQIPVGELEQIADSLPVPERNELGEVAVEAQPSVGLQESSATMVNETLVSEVMAVEPQEVPSADQLLHAACAAPSGAESALQEHEKEKAPVTDSTQTALQDDATVLEPEGAGALQQGDQIAPDGEQSGKENPSAAFDNHELQEHQAASVLAAEDASQAGAQTTAVEAAQQVDAKIPTSTQEPRAGAVGSEIECVAVVAENTGGEQVRAEEAAEPVAPAEEGVDTEPPPGIELHDALAGSEMVAVPQQTAESQEPSPTLETVGPGVVASEHQSQDCPPAPATVSGTEDGERVNLWEHVQSELGIALAAEDEASDAATVSANLSPRPGPETPSEQARLTAEEELASKAAEAGMEDGAEGIPEGGVEEKDVVKGSLQEETEPSSEAPAANDVKVAEGSLAAQAEVTIEGSVENQESPSASLEQPAGNRRVLRHPPPHHPPFRGPSEESRKRSGKGTVVNVPNAAIERRLLQLQAEQENQSNDSSSLCSDEKMLPVPTEVLQIQEAFGKRASSASDSALMVKASHWSLDDSEAASAEIDESLAALELAPDPDRDPPSKDALTNSSRQGSRGNSRPGTQGSGGRRNWRAQSEPVLVSVDEDMQKQDGREVRFSALADAKTGAGVKTLKGKRSGTEAVADQAAGRLQGLMHLAKPEHPAGPRMSMKPGAGRHGGKEKKAGLVGDLERMLNQVKASDDSLHDLESATNLVQQAIRKTDEIRRMKTNPREVAEQIRRERAEQAAKLQRASKAIPDPRRRSSVQVPTQREDIMQQTPSSLQDRREEFEGSRSKDESLMKMRSAHRRAMTLSQASTFVSKMKALGDGNIGVAWRRHFDSDGDGELSFAEFCSGLARVNHDGDVVELWQQFAGGAGHMSLQALDPVSAMILEKFAKWCADFLGGPIEVFRAIDTDGSDSLTPDEFAEGLRELGFFEPENLETMPESLHSEDLVLENLYPLMDQNGRGNIQAEQLLFLEKDVQKKEELQKTLARQRQYGYEAALEQTTSEAQHMLEEHARNAHWDVPNDSNREEPRPKRGRVLAPFSEYKPLHTPFFTKLLVAENAAKQKRAKEQLRVVRKRPEAWKESQSQSEQWQVSSEEAGYPPASSSEGQYAEEPEAASPRELGDQASVQRTEPSGASSKASLSMSATLPRLSKHTTSGRTAPLSSSHTSLRSLRYKASPHTRRTRGIYTCSQVADLPDISTFSLTSPKGYFEEVARVSSKFRRSNGQWTHTEQPKAAPFDPSRSVDFFCQAKRGTLYIHYGVDV